MFDLSTLPVPGSLFIGGALYACASIIAGQVIGERTIQKSGWEVLCEHSIKDAFHAESERKKREDALVPQTDCQSLVGRWHPDLSRLCSEVGNPDLGGPAMRGAREAERLERELEDRQMAQAASGAGSRCECAAAVYRRENMLALGLYAGSARTYTPPQVANMEAGLGEALAQPICANFTGGAP